MKKLLTILLLMVCYSGFADSIETKLEQYKLLYEKQLINQSEYEKLKQEYLFPEKIEIQKPKENIDEIEEKREKVKNKMMDLKNTYITQLVGGTILLSGGIAAIGVGAHYRINSIPDISKYTKGTTINYVGYKSEVDRIRIKYIAYLSAGSGLTVIGIILDALGIHNKVLYDNTKNGITLKLSDEGIGLKLCLK